MVPIFRYHCDRHCGATFGPPRKWVISGPEGDDTLIVKSPVITMIADEDDINHRATFSTMTNERCLFSRMYCFGHHTCHYSENSKE